jgi:hypothetical protein
LASTPWICWATANTGSAAVANERSAMVLQMDQIIQIAGRIVEQWNFGQTRSD